MQITTIRIPGRPTIVQAEVMGVTGQEIMLSLRDGRWMATSIKECKYKAVLEAFTKAYEISQKLPPLQERAKIRAALDLALQTLNEKDFETEICKIVQSIEVGNYQN